MNEGKKPFMARSQGSKKAASTALPARKKQTDDDARWEESFRRSSSQLEHLAKEALTEHRSRKTRELSDYCAARKAGRKAEATEPRAVSATYDARSKRLIINLRSGATFLLPIKLVEGLESATRKEIAAVEILGNGSALHWETLDIDLSVPHLLMGQFGTKAWMSQTRSQIDHAVKPIHSDAEHTRALKMVDELWDKAIPGTEAGDKFEVLCIVIEDYEKKNFHIDIDDIKPCDCLRGLRYRENLTQKEMAVRLGVTQGNLSAMERGKRPIDNDLAKKIAAIFGGSYKSFL